MTKRHFLLGCVADDFTGASDWASFFSRAGIKTILCNEIPEEDISDMGQVIVIALKTRNAPKKKAIEESLKAIKYLESINASQYYIKYCSTFDSTPEGNIGPVNDAIMEYLDVPYTILCPSLPVNKRTVKAGHLYVDSVPLHLSYMKDHSLTPMWHSKISELMKEQSPYPVFTMTADAYALTESEIINRIDKMSQEFEHFYIVPDYYNDVHAQHIIDIFCHLPLLTGGSGLCVSLSRQLSKDDLNLETAPSGTDGNALILSGSCSKATLSQITEMQSLGGICYKVRPQDLLSGMQTKHQIWEFIQKQIDKDVLVYSSDIVENVRVNQLCGKEIIAKLLEATFAWLAKKAVENNIKRIIVAGGETSGAVTKALGYNTYFVGKSISSGVPILIPLINKRIRLVLKSGNFGERDFFLKALRITSANKNEVV